MHKNHVWSYDFVAERTSDGRAIRMLNIINEYTRECLAIRVDRKITANDVIDTLADIFIKHGIPQFVRSDNGPEFVAEIIRQWLKELGCSNSVHRTRQSLGEWIHGII
jgi:transposase InsO family protein